MAFDARTVVREVLRAIGERELAEARRRVPSDTLRAAMQLIIEESELRARVFVPHYWAVYLHDGHTGINPVSARKLVFFDDWRDDPRRGGTRPERFSQERRLTKAEYEEGLRINAERAARGQRPFMYVVDSTRPVKGKPWFDRMAQGASNRVGSAALRAFDRQMQQLLDTDPSLRPERKTARFDIG